MVAHKKKKQDPTSFGWDKNILGVVDTDQFSQGTDIDEKHFDIETNQRPEADKESKPIGEILASKTKKKSKVAHKLTEKEKEERAKKLAEQTENADKDSKPATEDKKEKSKES